MNIKNDRINKIKSFLRMQTSPMTVTEIHEALSKRFHLDVSRKTIERDMVQMIEMGCLTITPGVPAKYTLNKPNEVEVVLKLEKIRLILGLIKSDSELYGKLSKCVE